MIGLANILVALIPLGFSVRANHEYGNPSRVVFSTMVTASKNRPLPLEMLARPQKGGRFVGSQSILRAADFEAWPFTIETGHLMCMSSDVGNTIIFSAPASAGQPLRYLVVYDSSKSQFAPAEAPELLVSFEDGVTRAQLLAPVIEFGLSLCEKQRRLEAQ